MSDLLFQFGLSNFCVALGLAFLAMAAGAGNKRPHLAYLLWLLVFVKLMTPPIVTVPVMEIPDSATASETEFSPTESALIAAYQRNQFFNIDETAVVLDASADEPAVSGAALTFLKNGLTRSKPWLVSVWLIGAIFVFVWSLVRVIRFDRLLKAETTPAPSTIQNSARKLAAKLGLRTAPLILMTTANLTPMVWWAGGRIRVVLPCGLVEEMQRRELRWVLAHELAHVRRRDYLVRWLEWIAAVCFWWNPVMWWAGRNLRAAEEICCDDLVLTRLNAEPKIYANSILTAVESLARPAIRPPAMASEVNSGGILERRFKMIVARNRKRAGSRWLQAGMLLLMILVLPLGIAYSQDREKDHPNYFAIARKLASAVDSGHLTVDQAEAKMNAIIASANKTSGQNEHASNKKHDAIIRIKKAVAAGEISEEEARVSVEFVLDENDAYGEFIDVVTDQVGGNPVVVELKNLGDGEVAYAVTFEKQENDEAGPSSLPVPAKKKYEAAVKKIKTAISNGDISHAEGMAKLEAFNKSLKDKSETGATQIRIKNQGRNQGQNQGGTLEFTFVEEVENEHVDGYFLADQEEGEEMILLWVEGDKQMGVEANLDQLKEKEKSAERFRLHYDVEQDANQRLFLRFEESEEGDDSGAPVRERIVNLLEKEKTENDNIDREVPHRIVMWKTENVEQDEADREVPHQIIMWETDDGDSWSDVDFDKVLKKIKVAVAEGHLSEAEAKAKLKAIRKAINDN